MARKCLPHYIEMIHVIMMVSCRSFSISKVQQLGVITGWINCLYFALKTHHFEHSRVD